MSRDSFKIFLHKAVEALPKGVLYLILLSISGTTCDLAYRIYSNQKIMQNQIQVHEARLDMHDKEIGWLWDKK